MLLRAASKRKFCISSCCFWDSSSPCLRLQLLQGVVERGERQAAEAVVGGNAQQQESEADVEGAEEDARAC